MDAFQCQDQDKQKSVFCDGSQLPTSMQSSKKEIEKNKIERKIMVQRGKLNSTLSIDEAKAWVERRDESDEQFTQLETEGLGC